MADFPAPPAPPSAPHYTPGPPPPPRPRRLARSSRERMWAGVAGGMAEYFDLDPALVRLLWVAATIVTGGLAVPLYIIAWIILPRDDQPPVAGPSAWRDWSQEFHNETRRMADEARRVADTMRDAGYSWRAEHPAPPAEGTPEAATDKGTSATASDTAPATEDAWWRSERYVEPRRGHRHPKSTGVVLVALGVFLLLANSGLFTIDWRYLWPLIFIGLGVLLLARQGGWGR
jgi:phage shock protein C